MMKSPCAILITRMTPKMTARPSEMMSRIATMLKPVRNCVKSACAMDPRPTDATTAREGPPGPSTRVTKDHYRDAEIRSALALDRDGPRLRALRHLREVTVLVRVEHLRPWFGMNPVLRRIDDVELSLGIGLPDSRPQPGVMVLLVDLDLALRRLELLARQAFLDQGVRVGTALQLFQRLREEVCLEIGGLHDRVRYLVLPVLALERLDEPLVLRVLEALEVVERGVVTDGVLRAHRLDLLLGRDRAADGNVLGRDAELAVLLVEGHDRVADEVGKDHVRLRRLHLVDVGTELRVAERRILFGDGLAAVLGEQRLNLAVGLLRIDVVRANEIELRAHVLDQPGHKIGELLVRHRARVEAVVAALLRFVERRVQEHTIVLLEHGQHRLTAGRGVAPQHRHDLVLEKQLLGLLLEEPDLGLWVLDNRLDLLAEDAPLGVDFLDRKQLGVV